jgi:hypothetical protein
MKGIVISVMVIILTTMLIGMAAYNLVQTNTIHNKETEIAFRKAEIIRTKNTFYLTNRSLETTWFMSTVQDIFDAGENSLGMTYWYERDINGVINEYRPGKDELTNYLEDNMNEYTEPIERGLELPNNVEITISDIEPDFDYVEEPAIDNIVAEISGNLMVSYADTVSSGVNKNTFEIPTLFLDMINAGILFVDIIKLFSADHYNYMYESTYANYITYLEAVQSRLSSMITGISLEPGVLLRESGLDEATSLFVPNSGVPQYDAVNIVPHQGGLVLQYAAYATFEEDNEGFYYHDEAANEFIKNPFFLTVKAQDYVPALECSENNGVKFNYNSNDDMICYNNELYTCDRGINGLVSSNRIQLEYCLTPDIECNYDHAFRNCETVQCGGYCIGLTYYPPDSCNEECIDGSGCYCECETYPIDCDDNDICTNDYCYSSGCYYTDKCPPDCDCDPATGECICPECSYDEGGCNDITKWCWNGVCIDCSPGFFNCNDIDGCECEGGCPC